MSRPGAASIVHLAPPEREGWDGGECQGHQTALALHPHPRFP